MRQIDYITAETYKVKWKCISKEAVPPRQSAAVNSRPNLHSVYVSLLLCKLSSFARYGTVQLRNCKLFNSLRVNYDLIIFRHATIPKLIFFATYILF